MSNMAFVENYLYLLTFGIIAIGTILFLYFKKTFWLTTYKRFFEYFFLATHIVIITTFISYNITIKAYHNLTFTDLCPFVYLVSTFALIFRKEVFYKALMPWLIIGALFTIFGSKIAISKEGMIQALLSYFRHVLMLIEGMVIYVWVSKYSRNDLLRILLVPIVLCVLIITINVPLLEITKDKKWGVFTTALLYPAYQQVEIVFGNRKEIVGDYSFFSDLGMPYPIPTFLFYAISIAAAYGIVFSKLLSFEKTKKVKRHI